MCTVTLFGPIVLFCDVCFLLRIIPRKSKSKTLSRRRTDSSTDHKSPHWSYTRQHIQSILGKSLTGIKADGGWRKITGMRQTSLTDIIQQCKSIFFQPKDGTGNHWPMGRFYTAGMQNVWRKLAANGTCYGRGNKVWALENVHSVSYIILTLLLLKYYYSTESDRH